MTGNFIIAECFMEALNEKKSETALKVKFDV